MTTNGWRNDWSNIAPREAENYLDNQGRVYRKAMNEQKTMPYEFGKRTYQKGGQSCEIFIWWNNLRNEDNKRFKGIFNIFNYFSFS